MRAAVATFLGACLLVAAGCASGTGPPPSASAGESAIENATPPCMGDADGECPSGDTLQDF
jgi:hypothetical protein